MQTGPHIEIAEAARPPNLDDVRRLVIEYLCDFLPPGAADERRLRPRDRNAVRLYQSLGWREIPPWDHHEVSMRAFELRLD